MCVSACVCVWMCYLTIDCSYTIITLTQVLEGYMIFGTPFSCTPFLILMNAYLRHHFRSLLVHLHSTWTLQDFRTEAFNPLTSPPTSTIISKEQINQTTKKFNKCSKFDNIFPKVFTHIFCVCVRERMCVCVCVRERVCVCACACVHKRMCAYVYYTTIKVKSDLQWSKKVHCNKINRRQFGFDRQ